MSADSLVIEFAAAGENIDGSISMLGPGVNGDVGLGNHDDATDTMRSKVMKQSFDNGATAMAHGITEQLFDFTRMLQARGIAVIEL
jgi:hypothetical protein